MSIELFVSDWNGTLFQPFDDEAFNRSLAYAVARDRSRAVLRGRLTRIPSLARLAVAKFTMNRVVRSYRRGTASLAQLYEPYNKHVVRGLPVDFVREVAGRYAAERDGLVDEGARRAVTSFRLLGMRTIVFSAAYDQNIKRLLVESGFDDAFDEVVSNVLEEVDGVAIGFTSRYRDDKATAFKAMFLEERGYASEQVAFSGDSEADEPIASMLPAGHFIVPLLATHEFRHDMVADYGAFAPENEADMQAYIAGL